MKKEYIKYGKCIWCLKEKAEVSFFNAPHSISKKIGATNIGFDICDSCNLYFGTKDNSSQYPMSVELAFKEIFNLTRHLLPEPTNNISKDKILRSVYFEYYKTKKTLKIKSQFRFQRDFLANFTRQFKRGVYEVFLQEFHRNTEKALDKEFDSIRKFVRYDLGDLPLYFADNKGVYLLPVNLEPPSLSFSEDDLKSIYDYGFYTFELFGHYLFLEVTPRAILSRDIFLRKEAKEIMGSGFIYSGIREMRYITDLDFALQRLYGKKS